MTRGGLLSADDARWLNDNIHKLAHLAGHLRTKPFHIPRVAPPISRFVRVVNTTTSDLEPFQCGKIKMPQVSFESLTNHSKAVDYETYDLLEGDDTVGRTCVVQEGIAVGKSGIAIAHGQSFARIDFDIASRHPDAEFCDTNSSNRLLKPLHHGTCEILDAESPRTDDTLATVRIGERRNCHAWGEAIGSVAPGLDMSVNLYDASETVTGHIMMGVKTNRLHTKAPDISAGDTVRIEWDIISGAWHLVNAVCPP